MTWLRGQAAEAMLPPLMPSPPRRTLGAQPGEGIDAQVARLAGMFGLRQLVEIGAGRRLGGVAALLRRACPDALVVSVERGRALTHPEALLDGGLIEEGEPAIVLAAGVLDRIRGHDVAEQVAEAWRQACPPGSLLAITHAGPPPGTSPTVPCTGASGGVVARGTSSIASLLTGAGGEWELVDDGVVPVDGQPLAVSVRVRVFGGISRRRPIADHVGSA